MTEMTSFFSSAKITVKAATAAEIAILDKWRKALWAFHKQFHSFAHTTMHEFEPLAESDLDQSHMDAYFIAYLDDTPVGYASCGISLYSIIGEINEMYIDEQYRHQGVGRQLMTVCITWLHNQGCTYCMDTVYAGNNVPQQWLLAGGWQLRNASYIAINRDISCVDMRSDSVLRLDESAAKSFCKENGICYTDRNLYFTMNEVSYMIASNRTHANKITCWIYGDITAIGSFINYIHTEYPQDATLVFHTKLDVPGFIDIGLQPYTYEFMTKI